MNFISLLKAVYSTAFIFLAHSTCIAQIEFSGGIITKLSQVKNIQGTSPSGLKYYISTPSLSYVFGLDYPIKKSGLGIGIGTFYNVNKYKYTLKTDYNHDNTKGYNGLNIYTSSELNPYLNLTFNKTFNKVKFIISSGLNYGSSSDFDILFKTESKYISLASNREETITEIRTEKPIENISQIGFQSQIGVSFDLTKKISLNTNFIYFYRDASSIISDSFFIETKEYTSTFTPQKRYFGLNFTLCYSVLDARERQINR